MRYVYIHAGALFTDSVFIQFMSCFSEDLESVVSEAASIRLSARARQEEAEVRANTNYFSI